LKKNEGIREKSNIFIENLTNEQRNPQSQNLALSDNEMELGRTKQNQKQPRKFSADEENNMMFNENHNSLSHFNEIETLKRNFNDNDNNLTSSLKENALEKFEVASSSNFSNQESITSSQEKFKKIRGFNFKNNINTKKYNKQILIGKDKISDNLGHYNSNGNNSQSRNFINLKSNDEKAVLLKNEIFSYNSEKMKEEVKAEKYNFGNHSSRKKYNSSSNSSNGSFSQNIDPNNKD